VLIVEDTSLYGEALARFLSAESWTERVSLVTNEEQMWAELETFSADAVLVNVAAHNSLALIRMLSSSQSAAVVALAVPETEEEVVACAEAGVAGFLFRGQSLDDLIEVVQRTLQGEVVCSPHITAVLMRRLAILRSEREQPVTILGLTHRERQVLALIERGCANKEIAVHLSISVRTVKNHVHNLLQKLQVQRRGEAAAIHSAHALRSFQQNNAVDGEGPALRGQTAACV
jgi:DNA-binding NarL/FixJ family response regulator